MDSLKEQVGVLQYLTINNCKEITIENSNVERYAVRQITEHGVAIKNVNNIVIYEKFVGVSIKSVHMNFNEGNKDNYIYLSCDREKDINKFMLIAEDFLKVENENIILTNPIEWVNDWKRLLGDSIKNKLTYDVIGELLVLNKIFKTDKTAIWQGAEYGVHDIEAKNHSAEVKSTISRSNTIINISGAFQLSGSKELNLYFVRLEKNKNGEYSIDSIINDLLINGYHVQELEEDLEKLGYPYGSNKRTEKYSLLEIRKFNVTKENFPVVTLEKINELAPKNNIIGYTLKLDLSSLEYENIL